MAVSIVQYPTLKGTTTAQLICPVYNPIVWSVSSTNYTQCNFQFVCDVYIEGVFIKRLKRYPEASNSFYGEFHIERLLEDYISHDLHKQLYGSSLFATNPNGVKEYVLKFGEEYDASAQCDAGTTVYPNLTLSTSVATFYAFNGAKSYDGWLDWYYVNHQPGTTAKTFITGMPSQALITMGSEMWFSYFGSSGNETKLQVVTYDDTGATLGTYTYTNDKTAVTPSQYQFKSVGVGPENLNQSTLLSGTQPVITQEVAYYTVQLLNVGDVAASEAKRIDIDRRESKYDHYRLCWLGRDGNFDSYTFTARTDKKIDISRTEYNKLTGDRNYLSPGNEWTYDIGDRGRRTMSVNAQESLSLTSNWLSEEEGIWMEELFTSPEVYLMIPNKKCCIRSITFSIDDSGGDPVVMATIVTSCGDFTINDSILINITDAGYEVMNAQWTPQSVSGNSITIATNLDPELATPGDSSTIDGIAMNMDYIAGYYPVIVKNTGFDTKEKLNVKNINYNIEVDRAYGVNIQRN